MPQKRNPDAAELVRAKTGRLNGALVALLTVMKGLPLAYQKDMQEDKVPVFEAADALELCLAAMAGMVRDMRPDRERLRAAAGARLQHRDRPRRLAGAARSGLPFRRAHHVTGAIVKRAEARGCTLAELPLAELQAVEPAITAAVYDVLDVELGREPHQLRRHRAGRVREAAAAARARRRFLAMMRSPRHRRCAWLLAAVCDQARRRFAGLCAPTRPRRRADAAAADPDDARTPIRGPIRSA